MTKRPGTQSDEDRALAELQRRRAQTPPGGVEVHAPEDRTPVTEVLDLADRMPDPEAREILRDVAAKIWNHTTNQELRHRAAIQRTEASAIRDALDEHTAADTEHHGEVMRALADIHGASGQNGKLGELRRRVDSLSKAAWLLVSVAVGGLGAAAIKLVMVVRTFDAVEARSMHSAAQLLEVQARVLRLETAAITRRYRGAIDAPERESP